MDYVLHKKKPGSRSANDHPSRFFNSFQAGCPALPLLRQYHLIGFGIVIG